MINVILIFFETRNQFFQAFFGGLIHLCLHNRHLLSVILHELLICHVRDPVHVQNIEREYLIAFRDMLEKSVGRRIRFIDLLFISLRDTFVLQYKINTQCQEIR